MSEQTRLDVLDSQRLTKEWIVAKIYLPDGQIVGGAPISVEQSQGFFRKHDYSAGQRMARVRQVLGDGANRIDASGGDWMVL